MRIEHRLHSTNQQRRPLSNGGENTIVREHFEKGRGSTHIQVRQRDRRERQRQRARRTAARKRAIRPTGNWRPALLLLDMDFFAAAEPIDFPRPTMAITYSRLGNRRSRDLATTVVSMLLIAFGERRALLLNKGLLQLIFNNLIADARFKNSILKLL